MVALRPCRQEKPGLPDDAGVWRALSATVPHINPQVLDESARANFGVAKGVSYLSQFMSLMPGDAITTRR